MKKSKIHDYDYENHLVDPTLPDEELIEKMEKFPEFKRPLDAPLDKAKVIRYIILFYDMAEELSQSHPDLMARKLYAADVAGFERVDRKFSDEVAEMLIGGNANVNRMIVRYVQLFPEPEYPSYIAYQSMLMQQMAAAMGSSDPKIIKEIRQNITDLNKQISALAEKIFRGETTASLIKALYSSMQETKLGVRPEDIARAIKDGTLDIGKGQYEEVE